MTKKKKRLAQLVAIFLLCPGGCMLQAQQVPDYEIPDSLARLEMLPDPEMYSGLVDKELVFMNFSNQFLNARGNQPGDTMIRFLNTPPAAGKPAGIYHPKKYLSGGKGPAVVYTSPAELLNYSFIVKGVRGMEGPGYQSRPLADFPKNIFVNWLEFKLLVKPKNEIVYWRVDAAELYDSPFMLRSNLTAMETTYGGKELIARYELHTYYNDKGNEVIIPRGSKWKVAGLFFSSPADKVYKVVVAKLEGNDGSSIIVPVSGIITKDFVTQEEFNAFDNTQKKMEAVEVWQQAEIDRPERIAIVKLRCQERWGKVTGALIDKGAVKLGMTMEMCLDSRGEPKATRSVTTADGVEEIWKIHENLYLHFAGNKLFAITE